MFENTVLRHPEDEGGGGEEMVAEVEAAIEAVEEPAGPLAFDDEAEVTWDGLDSPLTGKEIREGYLRQSDYTRKTQELANQQKTWEQSASEGQRWQQYARELEAQMQQQQQQPQPPPAEDPVAQIWEQIKQQGGIATDRELRALLDHAQKTGVGSLQQEVETLKGQLQYVLNDYVGNVRPQLGQMTQQAQTAKYDQTLRDALKEAKVPDKHQESAEQWARDMFHSFEPDRAKGETWETFMGAFPSLFADRWRQLTKLSLQLDRDDLADAKSQSLPRSGGGATPSKPMKPKTEIADYIDEFEPEGGWTD